MDFQRVNWEYERTPECKNGDIVVFVQYGDAEITKFVTPKPKEAPPGGGDFILEMREIEDGLEEKLFKLLAKQHSIVNINKDNPYLFLLPSEYLDRVKW